MKLEKAIEDVVRINKAVLGLPSTTLEACNLFQDTSTGLSFYIPNKKLHSESDNGFYERLEWTKAAGFTPEKDF